jgi:hypothetical protein
VIQVTSHTRILVAVGPVDFRNYAGLPVMPSRGRLEVRTWVTTNVELRITGWDHNCRNIVRSRSGGWNRPRRNAGARPALRAASFSVGSARRCPKCAAAHFRCTQVSIPQLKRIHSATHPARLEQKPHAGEDALAHEPAGSFGHKEGN